MFGVTAKQAAKALRSFGAFSIDSFIEVEKTNNKFESLLNKSCKQERVKDWPKPKTSDETRPDNFIPAYESIGAIRLEGLKCGEKVHSFSVKPKIDYTECPGCSNPNFHNDMTECRYCGREK